MTPAGRAHRWRAPALAWLTILLAMTPAGPSQARATKHRAHAAKRSTAARVPAALRAGAVAAQTAIPKPDPWHEARLLADHGRHEAALALLRPLIATDTSNFGLRWLEADVTGEAGRHAESVAHYERLSAAFPDRAEDLRSDLASERLEAGDSRGAARDLRQWLVAHPEDRSARTTLAQALAQSDSLRQSVAVYDALVREEPDDLDLACERAKVLGWMGRHDDAIAAYRAVLARSPDHAGAQLGLAMNENWSGRHRTATRQLEYMQTRPGADPEVGKTLAFARYWDEDPDGAQRALATYREHAPGDSEAVQLGRRIAHEQHASVQLEFGREDDSDGLHVASPQLELGWPLAPGTTGSLGWRNDLTHDGIANRSVMRTWVGLRHRFSPIWTAYARGAQDNWDNHLGTRFGGEAGIVNRPLDRVRLEIVTAREPIVTRLALQNGISLLQWIGTADWMPLSRWTLHADARAGSFSDGNRSERTGATLRHETWSSRRTDLSLEAGVEQLNTHQDLDHGYYDPDFHREWGPGAELEWRADERWTLGGTTRVGWQRDKGDRAEPYYGVTGRVRFEQNPDLSFELEAGRGDSNLQTAGGYSRAWWRLSINGAF